MVFGLGIVRLILVANVVLVVQIGVFFFSFFGVFLICCCFCNVSPAILRGCRCPLVFSVSLLNKLFNQVVPEMVYCCPFSVVWLLNRSVLTVLNCLSNNIVNVFLSFSKVRVKAVGFACMKLNCGFVHPLVDKQMCEKHYNLNLLQWT